jgi:hypothetical protein
MAVRKTMTDSQKKQFLETLRDSANVTAGAERAGITRHLAYATRKRDKDFRRAWDDALQAALDDLEGALRGRALHGVEQPVFYGGKECGRVRTYNDALGMFLLRGRRSDVFNAKGGKGDQVDDRSTTGNAREMILQRLAKLRRSPVVKRDV